MAWHGWLVGSGALRTLRRAIDGRRFARFFRGGVAEFILLFVLERGMAAESERGK